MDTHWNIGSAQQSLAIYQQPWMNVTGDEQPYESRYPARILHHPSLIF